MRFAKLAPLASCVLSFLAGVGYADGFGGRPARDTEVVVGRRVDGLVPLDLAAVGVSVEPIGIAYVDLDGRGLDLALCRPSTVLLEGP